MPVEMYLDDPDKSVILGLPPTAAPTPKVFNPFYAATQHEAGGNRKEAERIYLELLNADFTNPVLQGALGMNYAVAEKNGLANLLLNAALANLDGLLAGFARLGITPKSDKAGQEESFLRTKRSELLNAIGTTYKHENRIDEARKYFTEAQALIPPNADIQNNLGTLYINEGDPQQALTHLNEALRVAPGHPQSRWNRALANLELGNYEAGWGEYDAGLEAKVRVERTYSKQPLARWDGSPGKRLVVYGEQGIGDEILFASMLPDVIRDSKQVVFECHKKLHTLLCNSFPQIDIYPTREDEVLGWPMRNDGQPRYDFDAKIASGSLGRLYRPTLDSFPGTPYLKPTPASELRWNEALAKLGRRPKIGVSWVGGHKRTRMEVRSVTLEQLLPILRQDATFISLQYTPCEHELAEFEAKHGIHIHHWPEACYSADYDDTAGLVANCDLVVTVCTSVVHLAGAMGVPTWVITPSRPAWRYRLDLDTMPWYNSVTLFRQQGSDWTPVITEVAQALEGLLTPLTQEEA